MHSAQIIDEFLGPLSSISGVRNVSPLVKLHELISLGLPASIIGRLEKSLNLSAPESVRILAVSKSSRNRLKQTPGKRLDAAASDRIVRVVSMIAEAVEIFGDKEKAIGWFKTPSPALQGELPINLITSDPGAKLVRDELNRIRYGHWA